ncbi:hypothetical protein VNO78_20863 [Psophocarpus tetragonolobus]|uniref:Uncharacterized protein n=1 Tax=Psophocarpus tetragonolobus TaxID=3891 RepID=A0AAN9XHJ9_PSOTE
MIGSDNATVQFGNLEFQLIRNEMAPVVVDREGGNKVHIVGLLGIELQNEFQKAGAYIDSHEGDALEIQMTHIDSQNMVAHIDSHKGGASSLSGGIFSPSTLTIQVVSSSSCLQVAEVTVVGAIRFTGVNSCGDDELSKQLELLTIVSDVSLSVGPRVVLNVEKKAIDGCLFTPSHVVRSLRKRPLSVRSFPLGPPAQLRDVPIVHAGEESASKVSGSQNGCGKAGKAANRSIRFSHGNVSDRQFL